MVPLRTYLARVRAPCMVRHLAHGVGGAQDFGAFNTLVALGIAVTKATLVVLFFMHVKYRPRLTQLVVAAAVRASWPS